MRSFLLRLIALVCAALCLLGAAAAESAFAPVPWSDAPMPAAPRKECYLPDNGGYHDDSIDVRVETMRRDDTDIMLVYVTIADPSQLRTGTAAPDAMSRRTAPVSAMAKHYNAVLAINGDYFGFHSEGIVVRNTRTLRTQPRAGHDTLIIDENGDFTILSPTTREAYEAFPGQVVHAFCFGPGLVIDGKALESLDDVHIDNGKARKNQRIAIGQLSRLSYLIVATEGPENKGSVGFDLLQMAQLCK